MFTELLHRHSGVARTSALQKAGVSKYRITRAVTRGELTRVRRGWVALPTADPDLIHAAQQGLVLSCVSQAARLSLWVTHQSNRHFAVPRPGAESRPPGAKLHYGLPLIPLEPYALTDTIENVLLYVTSCLSHDDAVATWDSALAKKLVTRSGLERLPLPPRARRVLADTDPFADSGLETLVRQRLKWIGVSIRAQTWLLGHRVDFLIGERLVVQLDGGHHVGAQRTSDIAHDAQLRLHGYTVLRFGYEQVVHHWPEVQHVIMQAVAQQLHCAERR